jgi:nitroreductase
VLVFRIDLPIFVYMEFKHQVTELIRQRRSVRSYSPVRLESGMEQQVRDILHQHAIGPLNNQVTFQLVESRSSNEMEKVKIGTYGFIKGARHFVAGVVGRNAFAEEDYGYLLEKIILHLLEKGLGTCWLGGTFKRSEFTQLLSHSSELFIPAVTPVGYPADTMSKRERLIRKGAGSDRRKPWDELFFDETFSKPLRLEKFERDFTPFEMVRLAPSASNKQPWRVVRSKSNFHFILDRTPGYTGFVKNVDLQRIDMGIAMAHFELSFNESGQDGSWEILDHGIALAEGSEYIVSWVR